MRTIRRLVLLLVLLASAGAFWWFQYGRGPEVAAAVPVRGTAVEIVYGTGAVEPVRWAKVASLIRGRIVEVCACEGQSVRKGDLLVRLDDGEVRAQLHELRAREDFAKREVSRLTELIARGAATTQAHERALTEMRAIQGLITVLLERLQNYTINAPIDGVVLRRDGEVGEIAESGQILFRVGELRPLRVVAEVNEEDIPRVKIAQKALLRTDAFAERRLEGAVREITPMGDPVARTYRVYIALPDDTPLLAGMNVEANIVTREKADALLVATDAVRGNTVFVLDGNHVRQRIVTVGIRGSRAVEIVTGLLESDRVASPATGLIDGQRVRVVERKPTMP
jgi:RND family efflux transporter MFP subunit